MASAWMATATPLTLARLRSGRFQPNPRSLSAVWGRSQVVDKGGRGSPPAPIGWARCPSGGRTRELAWTDRPTPSPGPGVSHQTARSPPNLPGRIPWRLVRRTAVQLRSPVVRAASARTLSSLLPEPWAG